MISLPYNLGEVKKIGILGLGKTNSTLIKRLRQCGIPLILRSRTPIPSLPEDVFEKAFIGDGWLSEISEELLLLSPSVRRDIPEISNAQKRGVRISSDTELFFEYSQLPVLAITGSSGKSSVTYLTSQMTDAVFHSPPASNFGLPLCELWDIPRISGAVIELSSFQLQYMKPRCKRAAITNITENHLNWHKDFSEYAEAKMNVFANAEQRVAFVDEIPHQLQEKYPLCAMCSMKMSDDMLKEYGARYRFSISSGMILLNGIPYLNALEFKRKEDYTVANVMTAAALSIDIADFEDIRRAANGFCGLPHRAEKVFCENGIEFINSSIDTTPERTAATLSSIGKKATVIIMGEGKGLSYRPLTNALKLYASGTVILGACKNSVLSAIEDAGLTIPIRTADNLYSAVEIARGMTKPGECVLLSPAHTSYDAFRNFEERGDSFKEAVLNIVSVKHQR